MHRFLDPNGDGILLGELDAVRPGCTPSSDPSVPDACCTDPDGDCLVESDNCPSITNRDQFDRDGDGTGDPCDACPHVWEYNQHTCITRRAAPEIVYNYPPVVASVPALSAGQPVGFACGSPDRAPDTYVFVAERAPGASPHPHTDPDNDGVPTLCDNCPAVPNPDQHDTCHNGMGDACQPDADGDGIPDVCDTCPFTPDTLFDCNADAEIVRGQTLRSDSCDPIPCAAVSPSTTRGVSISRDSIITTAMLHGPTIVASPDLGRPAVRTFTTTGTVAFRFCNCPGATSDDEGTRLACERSGIGCRLLATDVSGAEVDLFVADNTMKWNPMTLTLPDGTGVTTVPATFRSTARASDADIDLIWPFTTDPNVILAPFPAPPRAQGVIWSQARSSGACTAAADPTLCSHLASHYWSGIIAGGTVHPPRPVIGIGLVPWPAPDPVCLYCEGSFPGSFLGTTCLATQTCPIDSWVVRTDRIELPAAPQLSVGLTKSLMNPMVEWTIASEQREALGQRSILMVGAILGHVIARVTTVGSTLGLIEELAQGKPPALVIATLAPVFSAAGSPNPTGRGSILLGDQAELVTFGGDLFERQSLTFTDLVSGEEIPIPLGGVRPGAVIAATHRITSPSALVLDRVPQARDRDEGDLDRHDDREHDDREHVRLLLVDLRSATSRLVASFLWGDRFDRHSLVTLANGDSVLVASSSTEHRHRLIRFRVVAGRHGELRTEVLATAEGPGAVIAPPLVSREGVSVAVQPRGGGWSVLGYLMPSAAGHAEHERAEQDLDDCF